MNCAVYKTNASECLGTVPLPARPRAGDCPPSEAREPGCLNREKPGEAWEMGAFTAHILRLDSLKKAGAHFTLGDLSAEDWLGLEAMEEWRSRREELIAKS